MLVIDGSKGEGGGQVLRTALALSTVTNTPFRCEHIRSGRKDPGLKAQHLTCIKSLQEMSGAICEGAVLRADTVTFTPGKIQRFDYSVDIGTAGSITLLLQSLLLPCALADRTVRLSITGGTDVQWSMPWDYFANVLVPTLRKWARIECSLRKRGYAPKGGGLVELCIHPRHNTQANIKALFEQVDTLQLQVIRGVSHASEMLQSARVAERQAHAAATLLKNTGVPVDIRTEYAKTPSVGSGIVLWAVRGEDDEAQAAASDCLGRKGLPAEQVGEEAARELIEILQSQAPVDCHLADNLLPWIAMSGGTFRTNIISDHARTNIEVIERFLGKIFIVDETECIIRRVPEHS